MQIPKSQFYLFSVISQYGIILGTYQTFEKAYERLSQFAQCDLVEMQENDSVIGYYENKVHGEKYRIVKSLFTFDYTAELVEPSVDIEKKSYSMII